MRRHVAISFDERSFFRRRTAERKELLIKMTKMIRDTATSLKMN